MSTTSLALISRRVLIPFLLVVFMTACTGINTEIQKTPVDLTPLQIETFDSIWEAVQARYVYADLVDNEMTESYNSIRDEIAAGGMPYSIFIDRIETFLEPLPADTIRWISRDALLDAALENTAIYSGIGVFISTRPEPEPRILLMRVVPGSPAEAAGLAQHDAIYAIDGHSIAEMDLNRAGDLIRGPVNSKVILTVGTPGAALRDVTVQREAIGDAFSTNTITVQALDNGIVHVAFPPSYYNTLVLDLTLALRDLNSQDKLKGLILDLRASSNGNTWSIDTTVFLLDLFSTSARGEIYTRDSVSPITLDNLESRWTLVPLVILVGPDTRGGPEIFAATMQASRGTRLFGLPTPGEVEGWETLTLPDGSALTLVTTSFRTAFGDEIGVTGLRPDKLIEADWDSLSPTHDPVLDAAWEYLNGR